MDPFMFKDMGFDCEYKDLTGAKEKILKLNPIKFDYSCDYEKNIDGFIAHELQEVMPEAVVNKKDEVDEDGEPVYQKVVLTQLVPLLTAGLQEAMKELKELQEEVQELKTAKSD